MTRNYGLSRRPDSSGAFGNPAGSPRAAERGSVIPFPSGSVIAPDHSFESVDVTQTLFNVASVLDAIFIVLVTACVLVIGPFLLFFCEIH
jgi:hypothetical protein